MKKESYTVTTKQLTRPLDQKQSGQAPVLSQMIALNETTIKKRYASFFSSAAPTLGGPTRTSYT